MHNIYVNLHFSSSSSFISFLKRSPTPQPEAGQATPCLSTLKIHRLPSQAFNSHRPCRFLSDQERRQSKRNNAPCIHHRCRPLPFQYSMRCPPLSIKWIHSRGLCTPDLLPRRIIILHSLPIVTKSTWSRRQYSSLSLLCVYLPPQSGAGKLPQGLHCFPRFFRQMIMAEHAGQSKWRTCAVRFFFWCTVKKMRLVHTITIQDVAFCKRFLAFEKNPIRAT
jgi:hypothetical protein